MTADSLPLARQTGIDALRGLSVILVVLFHVHFQVGSAHSETLSTHFGWIVAALTRNGYEAVLVFFVISGFLISSHSIERWGSLGNIDLRSFYRRRASRILPCLLVLLLLLSILHLAGIPQFVIDNPKQSLSRALIAAVGLHLNWYEAVTGYLPANWDVLWSLSIEEAFYLVFPLACLIFGQGRLMVLVLLSLVLSTTVRAAAPGFDVNWAERSYVTGAASIAMGVLASLVSTSYRPADRTVGVIWACAMVAVAAVLIFKTETWPLLHNGATLALTFPTAVLLATMRWRKFGSQMPGLGWLRSIGRLSYEIYLTHMFAVWLVVTTAVAIGVSGGGPLCYVLALGASWALGWLTDRWLSTPADRYFRGASEERPRVPAPARSLDL